MARRGANRREQRKARRAERSTARQQRRDRRSSRQKARADRRQTRASRADTRRAEKTARAQARQDAKIAKQQEKTARRAAREAGREQRAANRAATIDQIIGGAGELLGEGGPLQGLLPGLAPGIFGGEEEFGSPMADLPGPALEELDDQPTALEQFTEQTGIPPAALFGGLALVAAGVGYFLLRRK
jgi:cobalamin biosynthesis Mg chelatase CobN